MFGLPSLRIGRPFGIPLEVNLSWLLIFALVAISLATQYFPSVFDAGPLTYGLVGTASALLFFASVVLHELSHSVVARASGIPISKVTLFVFGGVAQLEREPDTPWREFTMAVAGPIASLVLSGLFIAGAIAGQLAGASIVLVAPLQYVAVINLYVAGFNLLPGFPLDGGRVLRALLWRVTGDLVKATRWASRSGQAIGYGLAGWGLLRVTMGDFSWVWFIVLGWFLATLADSSYRQLVVKSRLHAVTVESIMSGPVVVVAPDTRLDELVERYFLGGRHSTYPVVSPTGILGVVTLGRVREIARAVWPTTRVADVVEADAGSLIVSPETTVDAVADRLASGAQHAVVVVRGGAIVGIVTRSDVLRALRVMSGK